MAVKNCQSILWLLQVCNGSAIHLSTSISLTEEQYNTGSIVLLFSTFQIGLQNTCRLFEEEDVVSW